MEQQKMLMEKMLQTLEQLSMEDLRKVYAFIRALLEIRHEKKNRRAAAVIIIWISEELGIGQGVHPACWQSSG